jgi:hypothetical protein
MHLHYLRCMVSKLISSVPYLLDGIFFCLFWSSKPCVRTGSESAIRKNCWIWIRSKRVRIRNPGMNTLLIFVLDTDKKKPHLLNGLVQYKSFCIIVYQPEKGKVKNFNQSKVDERDSVVPDGPVYDHPIPTRFLAPIDC